VRLDRSRRRLSQTGSGVRGRPATAERSARLRELARGVPASTASGGITTAGAGPLPLVRAGATRAGLTSGGGPEWRPASVHPSHLVSVRAFFDEPQSGDGRVKSRTGGLRACGLKSGPLGETIAYSLLLKRWRGRDAAGGAPAPAGPRISLARLCRCPLLQLQVSGAVACDGRTAQGAAQLQPLPKAGNLWRPQAGPCRACLRAGPSAMVRGLSDDFLMQLVALSRWVKEHHLTSRPWRIARQGQRSPALALAATQPCHAAESAPAAAVRWSPGGTGTGRCSLACSQPGWLIGAEVPVPCWCFNAVGAGPVAASPRPSCPTPGT